jgi:hypothetical protein
VDGHRVAISNHRLVAFLNDRVSFRRKDYAHGGKQKIMTVSADEFLRRFLIHVLERLTSSQLYFRSSSIPPVPRRCTVDSS